MEDSKKTDDVTIELSTVVDELSIKDFNEIDSAKNLLQSEEINTDSPIISLQNATEDVEINPASIKEISGFGVFKINKTTPQHLSKDEINKLIGVRLYYSHSNQKFLKKEEYPTSPTNIKIMDEVLKHNSLEDTEPEIKDKPTASEEEYNIASEEDEEDYAKDGVKKFTLSPCCPNLMRKNLSKEDDLEFEKIIQRNPEVVDKPVSLSSLDQIASSEELIKQDRLENPNTPIYFMDDILEEAASSSKIVSDNTGNTPSGVKSERKKSSIFKYFSSKDFFKKKIK